MLTRRETLKAVAAVAAMGPTALAVRQTAHVPTVAWLDNLARFRSWGHISLDRVIGCTNADHVTLDGRHYAPDTLLFIGSRSCTRERFVTWTIRRFDSPRQPWLCRSKNGAVWVGKTYGRTPFTPLLAKLTPVPSPAPCTPGPRGTLPRPS